MPNVSPRLPRFVRMSSALFALALSACAMSDDKLGTYLVSPDKYSFYSCAQIADATKEKAERERELEALMAKAGQGADGRFVSSIAYRPEYLSVNAELVELRKASAAKDCQPAPAAPPAPAAGNKPRR
jgi:hypothetical protein